MENRIKKIGILLSFVGIIIFVIFVPTYKIALSRFGSSGEEVFKIQQRLLSWGYYSGEIDGIYGSATTAAVKKFQRKNGLSVDGVAGSETLKALGLPAVNENGNSSAGGGAANESNVHLLARAINGEARGEPYTGQVAVGAVIMNRVRHASFPNTIAGVIYQPGAFTAVSDGQIHAEMEDSCIRAARDALNGWDPVGGAIYYYNPRTATNQWIRTRPVVMTIGKHVFCN